MPIESGVPPALCADTKRTANTVPLASPESSGVFGLLMRHLIGVGTPRGLQGRLVAALATLWMLIRTFRTAVTCHWSPVRHVSRLERLSIANHQAAQIDVREVAITTGR